MKEDYSLVHIVRLLWSKKKQILVATLLSGLITAGCSLLMDTYYKASTTFYPASTDLSNPQKILRGDDEIRYYGSSDDADRLFSIGESRDLSNALIDSFNLIDRYDINPSDKKARFKAAEELSNLFEIKFTERDAIEISVEDTDPQFAADMANYARDFIEKRASQMLLFSQLGIKKMLEANVEMTSREVAILADSLASTRNKYSIFNLPAQTEYFSTEIPKTEADLARAKGELEAYQSEFAGRFQDSIVVKKAEIKGLQRKLAVLTRDKDGEFGLNAMKRGITKLDEVGSSYFSLLAQYNQMVKNFEEVRTSLDNNGRSLVVVETALAPQQKSRPRRSLIVIAGMLFTGLMASLFFLAQHFWQHELSPE